MKDATLDNLIESDLDKIHRFLRLQRALDWVIGDLDRVVMTLGDQELNDVFLVRLVDVKQLLDRQDVQLVEMLSWWANIDTTVYAHDVDQRSLYEQLFLNNAVTHPVDDAFTL